MEGVRSWMPADTGRSGFRDWVTRTRTKSIRAAGIQSGSVGWQAAVMSGAVALGTR
jgi:hypothetical protein